MYVWKWQTLKDNNTYKCTTFNLNTFSTCISRIVRWIVRNWMVWHHFTVSLIMHNDRTLWIIDKGAFFPFLNAHYSPAREFLENWTCDRHIPQYVYLLFKKEKKGQEKLCGFI